MILDFLFYLMVDIMGWFFRCYLVFKLKKMLIYFKIRILGKKFKIGGNVGNNSYCLNYNNCLFNFKFNLVI